MNRVDLSSYRDLYLKTAHEYLNTLKIKLSLLKQFANDAENKFEIYRLTHSLKSQSFFMGYKQTGLICKTLESVFYAIKENKITLSNELFDAINDALQKITISLNNITKNQAENDFADDIKKLETFLAI